jgi:hypothetical protein
LRRTVKGIARDKARSTVRRQSEDQNSAEEMTMVASAETEGDGEDEEVDVGGGRTVKTTTMMVMLLSELKLVLLTRRGR